MNKQQEIQYWAHMLDECKLNEKAEGILTDGMIDKQSVDKWSVFTDEKLNVFLRSKDHLEKLNEDDIPLTGKEWRNLPFWRQLVDYVVSGKNADGSRKGWFEDRKFPTKVIKAENLTAKALIDALRDGVNVHCDYSTASQAQSIAASKLMSKANDANFLTTYSKYMSDVGDAGAVGAGAVTAVKTGSPAAGVGTGIAVKAGAEKLSNHFVQEFNDQVAGTEYEDLTITPEDLGKTWYEKVLSYVLDHPYITLAAVVSLVLLYKNRGWIWDRLKLGFSNLWQGTVIAKISFDLLDGTPLSFEYDLRFNKWRLLYRDFQWTGGAFPDESAVRSFTKTETCQNFIRECAEGLKTWVDNKSELEESIKLADDRESADLIEKVLDDLDDIQRSFIQLETRVG